MTDTTTDALWYKDAVIYQVHVKSFLDSNGDGIGDFQGLIGRLDYIAELGVTAVWVLPFYPSPRRDDGYDIAEYRGVSPDYGTLADARRFVEEAHARGLRVITELVINHTSDQHPWFQRARTALPGSAEREFYVWSDDDGKYAGTRIIFVDTEKSNWTWDAEAGAYYWHRFYSHQPDLNFDNPRVMDEVLSVMRFWLDIGVDGLRLDAVPYLVEREGTNNENLPETHALLKRIRAEMDLHAPGKMLLCEANQWPEDAQVYFGEGDECHMSFHFPLMPRMYMAIAREDRFPITDIMRQTPDIPDTCQWAIFLRNHDELTLEMVTDSERDYLWQTYAADRRARLNLGIRRRLAPLLERDRRRVELMNGLLLSMPGTPVIYYGDEIGMGDNIHLGDRDGVRTPMQWSPDRNGGFSLADPGALVLPPIQDPLYGFQAINVEAQAADQHSPLNWMRRMLAVRKRFSVFGRGTLRFLYPGNRKVMAYLRELPATGERAEDEVVLCVANLSRSAQAVELDLSAFHRRVPIEMVGGTAFPPVGNQPYFVTLPPYGFYWFLLAAEAALPSWISPPPEPLPDLATIVLRHAVSEVMQPAGTTILCRDTLPAYLPRRRWFAAKTERLAGTRIAYALPLPGAPDVLLAEVTAELPNREERYVLPLAVAWEDAQPSALAQQLALARVRRGARMGLLTDGFATDAWVLGTLGALRAASSLPLPDGGTLEFRPTSRMGAVEWAESPEIRRLSAEQSNSSVIVGDAVVLKIVRRTSAGIHPEGEMTRVLTERGFGNTAPLFGEVVRVDPDGSPSTLMLAQGFVRNQGDGWSWVLEALNRAAQDVGVTATGDAEAVTDALSPILAFASNLGRRLAEMHAVLCQPSDSRDFSPDIADDAVLDGWAESAAEQIGLATQLLRTSRDWPDDQTEALANQVADAEAALRDVTRRLAHRGHGALQSRIHGDFHLGQVLVVQGDAVIIDFEGEPARPLVQRRAKSSGMRDVAGLLRSYDYAAATAEKAATAASPFAAERRPALLATFRHEARARTLAAYREVLHAASRPWVPPQAETALLDLFLIEKAAYEVRYEAENRPAWLAIPLRGLASLATELETT